MLRYLNYDFIDESLEKEKIENCKEAEIVLEPTNKKCLFILGMLFVNGVKIKILNEKDINLENTNKSFSLMSYVWSKLSDNKFPDNTYSNVKLEFDSRIENIKRLGVKVEKVINNEEENKIFLICPVRNANDNQRKWIEDYVSEKETEGHKVHAPHLHTRQIDLFGGYAICKQNAEAVASSSLVSIYYDKESIGSVFDLGVTYALNKPIDLLNENEIEFNDNEFTDNLIKNWPYEKELKKIYSKK